MIEVVKHSDVPEIVKWLSDKGAIPVLEIIVDLTLFIHLEAKNRHRVVRNIMPIEYMHECFLIITYQLL